MQIFFKNRTVEEVIDLSLDSESSVASDEDSDDNEDEDVDENTEGGVSDSGEEEEENCNDIDDVSEQKDSANESSDLESNDGINIDQDDIEEEDNRGHTVLNEQESEDDEVEEEDEEEDNEENEEVEEIRNIDEEEEEEEEVVEEEGKPQYKTIIGKPQNPNILTIMADRNKGYPIVRFTSKGGIPVEYDMRIKRDREMLRGLIHTPKKGSAWSVLRKEVVKTKEIQKQKKTGRNHAPGFTTPSDDEDESSKISSAKNETRIKGRGKKSDKGNQCSEG